MVKQYTSFYSRLFIAVATSLTFMLFAHPAFAVSAESLLLLRNPEVSISKDKTSAKISALFVDETVDLSALDFNLYRIPDGSSDKINVATGPAELGGNKIKTFKYTINDLDSTSTYYLENLNVIDVNGERVSYPGAISFRADNPGDKINSIISNVPSNLTILTEPTLVVDSDNKEADFSFRAQDSTAGLYSLQFDYIEQGVDMEPRSTWGLSAYDAVNSTPEDAGYEMSREAMEKGVSLWGLEPGKIYESTSINLYTYYGHHKYTFPGKIVFSLDDGVISNTLGAPIELTSTTPTTENPSEEVEVTPTAPTEELQNDAAIENPDTLDNLHLAIISLCVIAVFGCVAVRQKARRS